jgi:tetratricopeptide (TPR) repeat protein
MIRRLSPAALVLVLAMTAASLPARAEDCPDNVPNSSRERRGLAKDWFSRAEAADAANDPIGAVKAYQCSLKMVPHAFTAFNLGRLAERTGDLELAVDAFSTYVKLAPESPDRTQIEAKIVALGERIKTLRAEQTEPNSQVVVPVPPKPQPDPPLDLKPAPPPEPTPSEKSLVEPPPSSFNLAKAAPWIVGGVGVAALAAGVVLNLGARGKMSDCRALTEQKRLDEAQAACDAAEPRAYASYALFGVAGAAAVADGILLFLASERTERTVAASPLPGGALLSGRFRF